MALYSNYKTDRKRTMRDNLYFFIEFLFFRCKRIMLRIKRGNLKRLSGYDVLEKLYDKLHDTRSFEDEEEESISDFEIFDGVDRKSGTTQIFHAEGYKTGEMSEEKEKLAKEIETTVSEIEESESHLFFAKTVYSDDAIDLSDTENLYNQEIEVATDAGEIFKAKVNDSTLLIDVNDPGGYACIFKYKATENGPRKGEILCIVNLETYVYFMKIKSHEKRFASIFEYYRCSTAQRKLILKVSSEANKNISFPKKETNRCRDIITEPKTVAMMFSLCKKILPTDLQYLGDQLIREIECGSSRRRDEAAIILTDILYAYIKEDEKEIPSFEECVRILKKYRYGDDELIEKIALRIRLLCRSENRGFVFCLLGGPGVGKTQIAKGIAECLGKNYCEIQCRDKNSVSMGGISRMYEGSCHGLVQETLTKYGSDCCMLLDEFDKMVVNDKDGNPYNLFDSVFDDRKTYQDTFTNVALPVENVCFILTFNDISSVPAHIKDRFEANIFYIESYDNDKKAEIGRTFIVPQYMERYCFSEADVQFTPDGLAAIAKTTSDAGAREFAQRTEELLGIVNRKIESGVTAPIIVNESFVKEANLCYSEPLKKTIGF